MSFVRAMMRLATRFVLALLVFSLLWVLAYRFVAPPTTYIMLRDRLNGVRVEREWRSLDELGRVLPLAAIAAEDARFCSHHGFDMEAIGQALKANERARDRGRTRLHGGSTISQQTAKNAFLWPQRSWLRKGLESWFTVLIELAWPKKRIMEVYLNIAEWGPGIYGAEAAAHHYFGKDAKGLTRKQAARLVSILPSPLKWSPTDPSRRVKRKARNVRRALGTVEAEAAACL